MKLGSEKTFSLDAGFSNYNQISIRIDNHAIDVYKWIDRVAGSQSGFKVPKEMSKRAHFDKCQLDYVCTDTYYLFEVNATSSLTSNDPGIKQTFRLEILDLLSGINPNV